MNRYWFLTLSSFGSRLPGDERGSYHNNGDYIPPNPSLRQFVQKGMRNPKVQFTNDLERRVIFQAIVESCKRRCWSLGALNVRTEHVHLLVYTEMEAEAETIAQVVKSKATQRLRRNVGRFQNDAPVWSKRYNEIKVADVDVWRKLVTYTLLKQGANDYLSPEQWLNYSRYWVVNPFRFERRSQIVFDGTSIRYSLKEDL